MKFLVVLSLALIATFTSAAPRLSGGSGISSVAVCSIPSTPVPMEINSIMDPILNILGEYGEDDAVNLLIQLKQQVLCGILSSAAPNGE